MVDASGPSEENPAPIFLSSPCTLEQLASMRIALYIWLEEYRKYRENRQMTRSDMDCVPRGSNLKFYHSANIPYKIGRIIESSFDTIVGAMKSWHDKSKFVLKLTNRYSVDISYRFDLVVFSGNGAIHLEDTLAKFFDDDSLEEIIKFEIACAFCVEKKIDLYWPMVSDTLVVEETRFFTYFMLHYWICKKRGELDRIPLSSYDAMERFILHHCSHWGLFQAIQYFLSSLSSEDRLVEIDLLCETVKGFKCVRNLLPRLEPSVQYHVLGKARIRILTDMIENEESIEYIVQCWRWLHGNGFVEAKQFYQEIILRSMRYARRFGAYTYIEIVLAEIWFNSPYRLKQYALNFHLMDILIESCLRRFDNLADFDRDISFLLALLSDTDINFRRKFFTKNWPKLIEGVRPAQFQKLIELCLVRSEFIDDFCATFTRTDLFRNYCNSLMCLGYQSELNELFNDLHSNRNVILDLKKKILKMSTSVFQKSREILIRHSNYIDYVFANDTAASKDFKFQILLSDQLSELMRRKIDKNDFSHVKCVAEVFVSSADREEILKNNFLIFFRDKIADGRLSGFDESAWRKFVLWCLNEDVRSFDKFMKSLPIETIFESAFNRCLVREPVSWTMEYLNRCKNADLDKFFMWYFKSKRASYENFKRARVEYYRAMDEADVERIFRRDKQSVVELMKRKTLRNKDIMLMNIQIMMNEILVRPGNQRRAGVSLGETVWQKCCVLWSTLASCI